MDDNADAKRILSASSGGLKKTTRTSPHHVAEYHATKYEMPQPYTP